MKSILLICLFFVNCFYANSQNVSNGIITRAIYFQGDTIPYFTLPVVRIISERKFKNEKEKKRYTKLVRDIKKVYPYAKLAGYKILAYNEVISKIPEKKTRKILLDKAEDELKKEFSDDIKKLTFSQGRLLIKLIDRETGNTSFEIIKQLRGGLQAFIWQSLAKMFGNDLKSEYDPVGEDKLIEEIVVKIENGDL